MGRLLVSPTTLLRRTSPPCRVVLPEAGPRGGTGRPAGGLGARTVPPGGKLVGVKTWLDAWPVFRQLTGPDPLGRGKAARSKATEQVVSRTATADRVVQSVCPYCAVGCGQRVFVKDEQVVQIEGDPDSPISRGRLCPKGSASKQLVTSPSRVTTVKYRRPHGTEWEDLDLDTAMEMIADRVLDARRKGWQDEVDGHQVNRTLGIASLGGATLDNEENYLMKKLYSAMGAVQIENQARI
jgi:formate dehydrogenase major subunit